MRFVYFVKMENESGKTVKRKRLSKNKKKSWRKVDTAEIDEFLEDERHQERTGGLIAEKPDESLFYVDKKVSEEQSANSSLTRKRKAQEKLKEIEIGLLPPPPKKKDKRAPAVIEKEASGKLSKKQQESLKQRRKAKRDRNIKVRTRVKQPIARYDLWGDSKPGTVVEDDHYLQVTKKKRVKAPERLQKPVSMVPAVEAPHPGMSYNPDYEEYQDLCGKAAAKEAARMKEEERIQRALDQQFPSAQEAPSEASKLTEMAEGLFDETDSDSNDNEGDDGDIEKLSVNPPVRRENKKDERKRKKEKEQKEKAKLAQEEKLKKMKENNFYRLKSIKADIVKEDKIREERAKRKAETKAKESTRTKRLSKKKFEEPDLDLKLSDELVGSLREIKPEGHLLIDRFQSYMKRNMLEVRGSAGGKMPKRKYKPKVFEKRSHRDVK